MGLKPGGSLPLGKQIGPVVAYVESGELTLSSDRPVTVSVGVSAGSTATAIATPTAGEYKTVLGPGASALIDDGVTLTAKNVASEATTFLVVSAYAAERENESSADSEPVGLTQQAVSIAGAEFLVGPGKLTIQRVVVESGGSMASDSGHGAGIGGIDLGAVEQGSANVAFRSGSSWLWPNFRDKPQDREPIGPGAKMTLAADDGYSTYDGASNWTVTSNEPLIVLRVVIMPGSGD